MNIKKILPEVLQNIPLSDYSTFKIGGKAKYFISVKSKEELIKALEAAKILKLPIFILGGGSNILFSDKGFKGLVIKCDIRGLRCEDNKIYAGAGVALSVLVKKTGQCSLAGMEWPAGIPGTLGGAIYGNAQAFGDKMSNSVLEVEALDIKNLKIKSFDNKACKFKTKNSVFKNNKNLFIISAVLNFQNGDEKEIKEKIKEHVTYRKNRHPITYPCAGSVFVNPEIKIKNKKLISEFPEILDFNQKGFIHAGYLIDKCNLRGKKIGGAQISEKHANFIINIGNAKQKDVLKLISLAKKKVKEKFGVSLHEEIIIVK